MTPSDFRKVYKGIIMGLKGTQSTSDKRCK
jgi:hypothetical protein